MKQIILAHAGVEHETGAEAAAHSAETATPVVIITAVTMIVIVLALRYFTRDVHKSSTKKEPKNATEKKQKDSN